MYTGCEHRYPVELDGLSPLEERLIALQAPFGLITKFNVDSKTPSGINYRKHVKGHIVVFPNKVEHLVATVLPHPLLQTIENIHISWSGSSKPGAADVGHLLQVRKSRVEAALSWLQRNNPLYEHVIIDHEEIDDWRYADGSNVPTLIMDRMQREEPSTVEKTQTDHIVPDTDRGLEDNRFTSIEDLLTSIYPHPGPTDEPYRTKGTTSTERHRPPPGGSSIPILAPEPADGNGDAVYETSSSGMFPLDGPAAFGDVDKLSFFADVMKASPNRGGYDAEPCAMRVQTTREQPFIRVERGAEFADNFHEDFFPRTFPKLFPWE
ncbi:ATP-dependent DNA helicase PIF1 [Hirsutella rhossiliensis]